MKVIGRAHVSRTICLFLIKIMIFYDVTWQLLFRDHYLVFWNSWSIYIHILGIFLWSIKNKRFKSPLSIYFHCRSRISFAQLNLPKYTYVVSFYGFIMILDHPKYFGQVTIVLDWSKLFMLTTNCFWTGSIHFGWVQGPLHVVWQVFFGFWVMWSISSWQEYYKSVFFPKL